MCVCVHAWRIRGMIVREGDRTRQARAGDRRKSSTVNVFFLPPFFFSSYRHDRRNFYIHTLTTLSLSPTKTAPKEIPSIQAAIHLQDITHTAPTQKPLPPPKTQTPQQNKPLDVNSAHEFLVNFL